MPQDVSAQEQDGAVLTAPRRRRRLGPWQALWLLLGFVGMQFAGVVGVTAIHAFGVGFAAAAAHRPVPPIPFTPRMLAEGVVVGYALSAVWSVWYVRRRAGERMRLGAPDGVAWRPAPGRGYAVALVLGLAAAGLAAAFLYLIPVNPVAISPLPLIPQASYPLWLAAAGLAIIFVVAPMAEEFVFRGGMFAALAGRMGAIWAGVVTTIAFVALHAPQKIHYPPGFIDVGAMAAAAAWVRVRYQSIRPAMLLHFVYNGVVMITAMLLR